MLSSYAIRALGILLIATTTVSAAPPQRTHSVVPNFECYDPATGSAHFGYVATSTLEEDAFTLPYTLVTSSKLRSDWTFVEGCWRDAFIADVGPQRPGNRAARWIVGGSTAWVDYSRTCPLAEEPDEACPLFDSCGAPVTACAGTRNGTDTPVYQAGACACTPSSTVNLGFSIQYAILAEPLLGAFGMTQAVVDTLTADPDVAFASGVKPQLAASIAKAITDAASRSGSPLHLARCVLPSEVTVSPSITGPGFAVTIRVSIQQTSSLTTEQVRTYMQSTPGAWESILQAAENDVCSAGIIPQPATPAYLNACSQALIDCTSWPTVISSVDLGYTVVGLPFDFGCSGAGPRLFLYDTVFVA